MYGKTGGGHFRCGDGKSKWLQWDTTSNKTAPLCKSTRMFLVVFWYMHIKYYTCIIIMSSNMWWEEGCHRDGMCDNKAETSRLVYLREKNDNFTAMSRKGEGSELGWPGEDFIYMNLSVIYINDIPRSWIMKIIKRWNTKQSRAISRERETV